MRVSATTNHCSFACQGFTWETIHAVDFCSDCIAPRTLHSRLKERTSNKAEDQCSAAKQNYIPSVCLEIPIEVWLWRDRYFWMQTETGE